MKLQIDIREAEDHLLCTITGSFSIENVVKTLNAILEASTETDIFNTLLDATAIADPAPAVDRLLSANQVHTELRKFEEHSKQIPRIAVVATPPFLSEHNPSQDYFEVADLPIRVFADSSAALSWLLQHES